MSALLLPLRQLVASRLWPLALLLVAVMVGAPLLLKQDPAPASLASTGTGSRTGGVVTTPDGKATPELPVATDGVKRRLGGRQDPFKPSGTQPKPPASLAAPGETIPAPQMGGGFPATPATPSEGSSPSRPSTPFTRPPSTPSGGSSGGSLTPAVPGLPGPVVSPVPTPAPSSKPAPLAWGTVAVRFDADRRVVRRLSAVPSTKTPTAIYLGLLKDRKTAVFLLNANVDAEGDGRCDPSPENCQRLYLRKGETEFLTEKAGVKGSLRSPTDSTTTTTDDDTSADDTSTTPDDPAGDDSTDDGDATTSAAQGTPPGREHRLDLLAIGMAGAPEVKSSGDAKASAARMRRAVHARGSAFGDDLRFSGRSGFFFRLR